ncbi:MAG: DUF805 domain-containing protein [Pseudomonadota bacterium]
MDWMMMPLRRYAEFGGRSQRMECGMFYLLLTVSAVMSFLIMWWIGSGVAEGMAQPDAGLVRAFMTTGIFLLVFTLFWLGMLVPFLAVSVRRLHDIGWHGWWVALPSVSFVVVVAVWVSGGVTRNETMVALTPWLWLGWLVGAAVFVGITFLPGARGPNRYGIDPKGRSDVADVFA